MYLWRFRIVACIWHQFGESTKICGMRMVHYHSGIFIHSTIWYIGRWTWRKRSILSSPAKTNTVKSVILNWKWGLRHSHVIRQAFFLQETLLAMTVNENWMHWPKLCYRTPQPNCPLLIQLPNDVISARLDLKPCKAILGILDDRIWWNPEYLGEWCMIDENWSAYRMWILDSPVLE